MPWFLFYSVTEIDGGWKKPDEHFGWHRVVFSAFTQSLAHSTSCIKYYRVSVTSHWLDSSHLWVIQTTKGMQTIIFFIPFTRHSTFWGKQNTNEGKSKIRLHTRMYEVGNICLNFSLVPLCSISVLHHEWSTAPILHRGPRGYFGSECCTGDESVSAPRVNRFLAPIH